MIKDILDKSLDFGMSHLEELTGKGLLFVGNGIKDNNEYIAVTMLEGSSIEGLPTQYEGTPVKYEFMTQAEYDSFQRYGSIQNLKHMKK